jgi:hypothetical protein
MTKESPLLVDQRGGREQQVWETGASGGHVRTDCMSGAECITRVVMSGNVHRSGPAWLTVSYLSLLSLSRRVVISVASRREVDRSRCKPFGGIPLLFATRINQSIASREYKVLQKRSPRYRLCNNPYTMWSLGLQNAHAARHLKETLSFPSAVGCSSDD